MAHPLLLYFSFMYAELTRYINIATIITKIIANKPMQPSKISRVLSKIVSILTIRTNCNTTIKDAIQRAIYLIFIFAVELYNLFQ